MADTQTTYPTTFKIRISAAVMKPETMFLSDKVFASPFSGSGLSEDSMNALQAEVGMLQARLTQSKILEEQLTSLNTQLYDRNNQVEKELYVARQLQQSLLPPFVADSQEQDQAAIAADAMQAFEHCHYRNDYLRITGVYLPCDSLGGDLYDVLPFPDGSVGVAVADVSGHGVPAGFITAIFKAAFYRMTHTYDAPWDIIYHLNNELMDIIKTGDYITGLYTRLTPELSHLRDENIHPRFKLDYAGAGHPYPYVYRGKDFSALHNIPEGSIQRLEENGMPMVWVKGADYPAGSTQLYPGDVVLLFTDGVSEMKNAHDAMFGEDALGKLLGKLMRERPFRRLDAIISTLSDFTEGHPLDDDLSIVLIEVF